MFYSPTFRGRGLGEVYPREPTLLLHPPMIWKPDFKKTHDRPVEIWFNDGYVGDPETTESLYQNGTWGPLDLIYPHPFHNIRQVGVAYTRILPTGIGSRLSCCRRAAGDGFSRLVLC